LAKVHPEITPDLADWMAQQAMYFLASAPLTNTGHINVSPRGVHSLCILNPLELLLLDLTGSGNETSAHIQENSRMTIMFSAFEGSPMILRLYGNAKVIHKNDTEWNELFPLFNSLPGARQIFDLTVDLVQTSCGMAVPFFDYAGEREQLKDWAVKKGDKGIKEYWKQKNQFSLDGKPTNIMSKNV